MKKFKEKNTISWNSMKFMNQSNPKIEKIILNLEKGET